MYAYPSGHNPKTGTQESGMTLRDYFAAAALPIVMKHWLKKEGSCNDFEDNVEFTQCLAIDSYVIADAMMKERDE
jgi:hypothetical protein